LKDSVLAKLTVLSSVLLLCVTNAVFADEPGYAEDESTFGTDDTGAPDEYVDRVPESEDTETAADVGEIGIESEIAQERETGDEIVETTEAEDEGESAYGPKPVSPPFFVYDFDFYREHKADYRYTSYGHFFGGGVNLLEKFDATFGFGVRGDSRDRLRKLIRFTFTSPLWKDGYGTAGVEYQFELDYNPNLTWIFSLYQEYGDDWTFDFYDELATYWNEDNFSNAFNFNTAYLMWYNARVYLNLGFDAFYIKRYNDYFRRIEWEEGEEGLGLMRVRGGVSKRLYEDSYGFWALKGEMGYDTDNVFTGIATTNAYYKIGSRLSFATYGSVSFDSLGYDIESIFAEFVITPF
jgi:hypothetical protein